MLIDNPSGLTASGLNAAAHISRGKYLVRVDSLYAPSRIRYDCDSDDSEN